LDSIGRQAGTRPSGRHRLTAARPLADKLGCVRFRGLGD